MRETALVVSSWAASAAEPAWPDREDPSFDRMPPVPGEVEATSSGARDGWQYVLEVWRADGMLVGAYLAVTRTEDDEHARRMALGQAILACAGGRGDEFDPEDAGVFVVDKRRVAPAG